MDIRACLAALALLALPACAAVAQADDRNDPPFARAVHHLLPDGDPRPSDYLLVRQLVTEHPEICARQDWSLPAGSRQLGQGATLLMYAGTSSAGAVEEIQLGGTADLRDADRTFRFILSKTSDAYVRSRDRQGRTVLDYCCGDIGEMEMVWSRFQRVRFRPNLNQTLMNVVTGSGSPDLNAVRWLVAHGANPQARDQQGYSIVQRAEQDRNPAVVEALEGR